MVDSLAFLDGGGEMGALTRSFNWTDNPMGPPQKWPTSLRTTLSIILNSRFPMFLFWGPENICFYNDAYRPSLGSEGKHPGILGLPGKEAWPEIWEILEPQVNQVLNRGEATWHDDQKLSIFRNGKMDYTFWTYSYSPVKDETGSIVGVFVTCTETTEKVRQDEDLRKAKSESQSSAALLQSVIDQSPMAIVLLSGPDFVIEIGNKKIFEFWDKTPAVTGKKLVDALPEIKGQGFIELLTNVYRTGEPFYGNGVKARLNNGEGFEDKFFDFVYTPMHNGEGAITGVVVLAIEVTTSFLAKQQALESEQRLRSIIEQAPIATCLFVGRDMKIEIANKLMQDAWGKGDSVIGKPLSEVVPELKGQPFMRILDEVYSTGVPYKATAMEAKLVVDGVPGVYYYDFTYQPILDSNGEVYAVMDMAIDVTSAVVAQRKMAEAEGALQNAIDLAALAVWTLNIKTGVVTASERFRKWIGSDDTEVINVDVLDFLDTDSTTGNYDIVHPLVNKKTGQVRIVRTFAKVFYDATGKPEEIRGTAQDITIEKQTREELEEKVTLRTEELRQSYEELARINKNLLHSNEELEQYAYIASHDLQEPLRKISIYASRLQASDQIQGETREFVNRIEFSSERMGELIRDLLEFSRLLKISDVFKQVDLNEILSNVINDFELMISEKNAAVHFDKLPSIEAIPLQMNQLFYNLVSNALKFQTEGIPPIITIAVREMNKFEVARKVEVPVPGSKYYLISIEDNGIGFDEKSSEKIFEIFKRLNPRAQFAGSGIGLALCRRIARNHSGALYATSKPGKGSIFNIVIPSVQVDRR